MEGRGSFFGTCPFSIEHPWNVFSLFSSFCLSMGGVQQSPYTGMSRTRVLALWPRQLRRRLRLRLRRKWRGRRMKLPIPVPVMHFGPDTGHVAVNFWTVLWLDNPSQITATATAGAGVGDGDRGVGALD